jgi:hypothetical protein
MKLDLVRFAHNWNDGKMEYWNIGSVIQTLKVCVFDYYSIIPCRRPKTSVVKNYMLTICYRNSET